jgi:hypothetical protein
MYTKSNAEAPTGGRTGRSHLRKAVISVTISNMKRSSWAGDQRGEANTLLLPLIIAGVLLIGAVVFGAWAFNGRQDYKNNVDAKIADAEKATRADEDVVKDKEHAEADKQPLKTYKGPDQYGSVQVSYPKTWSGYVLDAANGGSGAPLDGYFHPNVVPGLNNRDAAYALRVQIIDQAYAAVVARYDGEVKTKKLTAMPYAFKLVPKTMGVRLDGLIGESQKLTGTIIAVPLRDKTLQISTESPLYFDDFNTLILPNVTFSP